MIPDTQTYQYYKNYYPYLRLLSILRRTVLSGGVIFIRIAAATTAVITTAGTMVVITVVVATTVAVDTMAVAAGITIGAPNAIF